MRGNHRVWGRQDYIPPAPLTEEQVGTVSGLDLRPVEGKKVPTFEVYKDGVLVGYVRKAAFGPQFKMAGPDGFWHQTEATQDIRTDEEPLSRTLLMMHDWYIKRQQTPGTEETKVALGFKEKRELQRIVTEKQEQLAAGGLGFKDKRDAQKAMQDALDRLGAAIDAGKGDDNQKLADLIAGKYNDLAPLAFLKVLEEIVGELGGDVEPVKPGVVGYIDANQQAVMESAELGWMPWKDLDAALSAAPKPRVETWLSSTLPFGEVEAGEEDRFTGSIVECVMPLTQSGGKPFQARVCRVIDGGQAVEVFHAVPDASRNTYRLTTSEVLAVVQVADRKGEFEGLTPSVLESADQTPPPGVSVRMPEGMADGIPPRKIVIDIDVPFEEPAKFRNIVQAIESARAEDEIEVNLNTPGGRVDAAQAVYVALLKTPAKTKAKVINASSSGSIVAMACDVIETTPFCTMMIHNASTGSHGKVGEMMASVAYRDGYFRDWFSQLYSGFLSAGEIQDVMKGQDIWLKDSEIRARLENWKPIRQRVQANGTVALV